MRNFEIEDTSLDVLNDNELEQTNGGVLFAIIGWSYVGGLAYGYISEKLKANHTK